MSLDKRPLIVFGEDWGRHPSSTQHLALRLARRRDILWINSIGLRRPRLSLGDARRLLHKGRRLLTRRDAQPNGPAVPKAARLKVVDATALPFPASTMARRLNRRIIPASLAPARTALPGRRPIVWCSLPSAVDAIGGLDAAATVYYAGDDFTALSGVDHRPVARMEHELVDRADLVLAASEPLLARFPAQKSRLLTHGCDLELFSTPAPRAPDMPTGRPIAGFYGSLSDWLDVDLLAGLARRLPDWNIVLIGDVRCPLDDLPALPNVHLLGPRPHAALPAYLQHWQAALLPFRDTPQIRACNPLKLREYLASGTPVVATPFPAATAYGEHLSLSGSLDGFVRAVLEAPHDPAARRRARQVSVARESWEHRAAEVEDLLCRFDPPAGAATCHGASLQCAA